MPEEQVAQPQGWEDPQAPAPVQMPEWGQVESTLRQQFPGADFDTVRRAYQSGTELNNWRWRLRGATEQPWTAVGRHNLDMFGVMGTTEAIQHRNAVQRFQAGNPQPDDAYHIAQMERLGELDRQATSTVGGALWRGAQGLPGQALGFMAIGGRIPGGGAFAETPGVGGFLGRQGIAGARGAATMALNPEWVGHGVRNEMAHPERGVLDNYGSALTNAALNGAILGQLGAVSEVLPGTGAARAIGRGGIGLGAGLAEQQIADAASTTISHWTGARGLDTGYGTIGTFVNAIRGTPAHPGEQAPTMQDAYTQALVQAMQFSAFSAMHQGGRQPGVRDAFADASRTLARSGVSRSAAGQQLLANPVSEGLRQNPQLSRSQAQSLAEQTPEGPVRDYAAALAQSLPETPKPASPPGTSPAEPTSQGLSEADAGRRLLERLQNEQRTAQEQRAAAEQQPAQTEQKPPETPPAAQEAQTHVQPPQVAPREAQGVPAAVPEAKPRTIRDAFEGVDVLDSTLGGRQVQMRLHRDTNEVQIDFNKPKGEFQGIGRTLGPGTTRLARGLTDFAKDAKDQGLGLTFDTNLERAQHYHTRLTKIGYELVGNPEPIPGRPNELRYRYRPEQPKPEVANPLARLSPDQIQQLSEAMGFRKINDADALAGEFRRRGMNEETIANLADTVTKPPETTPAAPSVPPVPPKPSMIERMRQGQQGQSVQPSATGRQFASSAAIPQATPALRPLLQAAAQAASVRRQHATIEAMGEQAPGAEAPMRPTTDPDRQFNARRQMAEQMAARALRSPTEEVLGQTMGTMAGLIRGAIKRGLDPAAVVRQHMQPFLDRFVNPQYLKEIVDATREAQAAVRAEAQRRGVSEESVRFEVLRGLHQDAEALAPAAPGQGDAGTFPGAAPQGGPEANRPVSEAAPPAGEAAPAGGGEPGGRVLERQFFAPGEHQANLLNPEQGRFVQHIPEPAAEPLYKPNEPAGRLSAEHRDAREHWLPEADEAGVPQRDVIDAAADMLRHEQEALKAHNAIVSSAKRSLGAEGKLFHLDRYDDWAKIKGFDLLTIRMEQEHPDVFPRRYDPQGAPAGNEGDPANSQRLFEMMKEGQRQPDYQRAYGQALQMLYERKVNDAQAEARRAGFSATAAEEALQHGLEAGENPQAEPTPSSEAARGAETAPAAEESAAALEHGAADAGDFAFGFNASGPIEGGGGKPGQPGRGAIEQPTRRDAEESLLERLGGQAQRFLGEESGHLLIYEPEWVKKAYDSARATLGRWQDAVGKLAGRVAPRTARLNSEAADAIAHHVAAPIAAERAIPYFIDRVLGAKATEADARLYGTTFAEFRFRYVAEARRARATELVKQAQAATDPTIKQGLLEESARQKNLADGIQSFVGGTDSPLATEADYQRALNSPEFHGILGRWSQNFAPFMEKYFRMAEGLQADDPIDRMTQIPGLPLSVRGLAAEEAPTPGSVGMAGRGELRNPKLAKLGAAREFTGSAARYETDLREIIRHTVTDRVSNGTKAAMYRSLEQAGLLQWVKPGTRLEGWTALRDVNPPKGTQTAETGERNALIRNESYQEVRAALAPDQPLIGKVPGAGLATRLSLMSLVEGAAHSKNLMTAMFNPGMSPIRLAKNFWGVVAKNPDISRRVLELCEMGAGRQHALESFGREEPTSAIGRVAAAVERSPYSPLNWMSKAISVLDTTMRLTADNAFDSLQRQGAAVGTERNRRDFINQLTGQYNKRGQNAVVALLRDSGIGPFATAGTTYTIQGMRALTMNPNVTATSAAQALRLRAEKFMRIAGVLSLAPILNYLISGRTDGDDNTPLGGVRLGQDNGKTAYFDLAGLTGVTRGARTIGLLAIAEGRRVGTAPGRIADRAASDIVRSVMHPAEGPIVQFAHTAVTGENMIGMHVTARAQGDQSQFARNLQSALLNANPILGVATGANQPARVNPQPRTAGEVLGQMVGPFGVKYRSTPPGRPLPRH